MSAALHVTPAPVGQQAPPTHAATRLIGALRVARGSLLLTTGTVYAALGANQAKLKL